MLTRLTLMFLMMASALVGQAVTVTNHSGAPFTGWKRATIDTPAPFEAGTADGVDYVVGRKTGLDTRAVDLFVTLPAGASKFVDLSGAVKRVHEPVAMPTNIVRWYGGPLVVNGDPMGLVDIGPDGAAVFLHMRARTGRMFVVDVFLRHYMGQPWAEGEAVVTCSNPSVTDLTEISGGISLSFGDAVIAVLGRQPGAPLVDDGTKFADGQSMALPFTAIWTRNASKSTDWASIGAVSSFGVQAVGIDRIIPEGGPVYGQGMDALQWARNKVEQSIAAISNFSPPACGVAANSSQTGAQEDQIFVRGEAMISNAALLPTYLSGMKFGNRPCNHRENSGAPLDLGHEDLVIWSSRAHPHPNVGSDKLGKVANLAPWHVPGSWSGPDREHWLLNTLTAASRYTGSRALQQMLRNQAVLFLYSESIDPSLSTSHMDAARSIGYAGQVAVHLWYNLEDRDLAEMVRKRWRQRVLQVYIPEIAAAGELWDHRADGRIIVDFDWVNRANNERRSPRLYSRGTMMWQQSFGSWGLDYACEHLGPLEGRAVALSGAQAVLKHAWRKQNGTWIFWDNVGYDGGSVLPASEYREGYGTHRTGWFDHSWAVPGIAVILRHEPDNVVAQEIWDQVAANGGSWVPPGVR